GYQNEGKLRLFACACARHFWDLLDDQRSKQTVEVAEQVARGALGADALTAAWQVGKAAAEEATHSGTWTAARAAARATAWATTRSAARAAAGEASKEGIRTAAWARAQEGAAAEEAAWQADQLRKILGDAMREVIALARR